MAKIGSAEIVVGDVLRSKADDREGSVIATTDTDVTVRFPSSRLTPEGEEVTSPATDWYYNGWDAKFAASATPIPVRDVTDMTVTSAEAEADAARVEAEAEDARKQSDAEVEEERQRMAQEAAKADAERAEAEAARQEAEKAEASRIQALVDAARAEGAALALGSTELTQKPDPVSSVQGAEVFHEAEEV